MRVQKGRFLRLTGPKAGGFLSLTGLWPEGGGGGFAADYKKGARLRRWLCRRVVFASLRGRQPSRAEGDGGALSGDEFYNAACGGHVHIKYHNHS